MFFRSRCFILLIRQGCPFLSLSSYLLAGDFLKAFMLFNRSSAPLPDGFFASYHSTWMGTSLAEYGSALEFINSSSVLEVTGDMMRM